MTGSVILWIGATLGLKFYMTHVDNDGLIYRALRGHIVLLLWFYLTAVAMLAGAKINAYL